MFVFSRVQCINYTKKNYGASVQTGRIIIEFPSLARTLSNFQQGQEEEKDCLITFEKCEQGVRKFDSTAFCYVQHSLFNTAKE